MIDKLVLRCNFAVNREQFNLRDLDIPLTMEEEGGLVKKTYNKWHTIPSSFTDVAAKVFDQVIDRKNPDPFIEIKASPALVRQGHNVWGSDNLGRCAFALIEVLEFNYPRMFSMLDHSTWDVAEVDITYSAKAKTEEDAELFIRALQNVSNGRCRSQGQQYSTTVYFGKADSRYHRIKVYAKYPQILELVEKHKRLNNKRVIEAHTATIFAQAMRSVRYEVTVKKRGLQALNLPSNLFELIKVFNPREIWDHYMQPIKTAMQGLTMKTYSEQSVKNRLRLKFSKISASGKVSYGQADAAYETFIDLQQMGFDFVQDKKARATFYRHIKMLTEIGFSKAFLQNMTGDKDGKHLVPILQFVEVEFGNQYPDGVNLEPDFVPPPLYLVA